jgi:hypothetical protein
MGKTGPSALQVSLGCTTGIVTLLMGRSSPSALQVSLGHTRYHHAANGEERAFCLPGVFGAHEGHHRAINGEEQAFCFAGVFRVHEGHHHAVNREEWAFCFMGVSRAHEGHRCAVNREERAFCSVVSLPLCLRALLQDRPWHVFSIWGHKQGFCPNSGVHFHEQTQHTTQFGVDAGYALLWTEFLGCKRLVFLIRRHAQMHLSRFQVV